MVKEGWVIHNKKSIKIGGPTWKKLTPSQQTKLTKKSKIKNEKPKKSASSMKKSKKQTPRPKLFENVRKIKRNSFHPKDGNGWKIRSGKCYGG